MTSDSTLFTLIREKKYVHEPQCLCVRSDSEPSLSQVVTVMSSARILLVKVWGCSSGCLMIVELA